MFIKNDHIYLRALESDDLEILYNCENDTSVWKVSNTQTPFSKYVLQQYLETAHQDIYTTKQLRLVICLCENNHVIGTIDLFDFDPQHSRVGVGILIFELFRNKGYASQAIELLKKYAFDILLVQQVFCNISSSNKESIALFEKTGFLKVGVKKQWNKIALHQFEDEIMYQLLSH